MADETRMIRNATEDEVFGGMGVSPVRKGPTLYECQFFTLSEVLTPDEYETVSEILDNNFTWGDSEVVLVKPADIRLVFDERAMYRRTVKEMDAVQKVRDAMDQMGDSVYVNLY